jgi:hypothetical protein
LLLAACVGLVRSRTVLLDKCIERSNTCIELDTTRTEQSNKVPRAQHPAEQTRPSNRANTCGELDTSRCTKLNNKRTQLNNAVQQAHRVHRD